MKKVWRTIASVLLLVLGVGGLQGLRNNLGSSETLFQHSVLLGQIVLGVAGVTAGVGGLRRKPWAGAWTLLFAAGMAYSAGAGPVAWGETGWPRGALDASLGFLIGFVLYLGVRSSNRSPDHDSGSSSLPRA